MVLVPLAPPPGLDSDDTAFKAQDRWIDCTNVRPYNGSMQAIGTYDTMITAPVGLTITELAAFNGPYIMVGATDSLWVSFRDFAPTEITPVGLGAGHQTWSFSAYGNTVICNPFLGKIYQHTLGGGVATVIATAPASTTCSLVTRRQVLAFGTNEEISTTFNGRCIRGSDFEDPTDWTTTSTNSAFEDILDDEGTITAARVVGDYLGVWTTTGLWLGTFLGDPSQTYRWEKVAGGQGATGPNAVCVDGQVATWFAPDLQLWQWSPGVQPVPVSCPISRVFLADISETSLIRIVALPYFNEVWLFYASAASADGRINKYIAFNRQGQWFKGQLARDAVCANGIVSALVQLSSGEQSAAGGFLAAKANVIYMHEIAAGTQPAWDITSGDQYLDNGKRRVQIQRFVPDFSGQAGNVLLTLHMRSRPQSTAVDKGPYTIATTDKKKDFRASGMMVSAKFEGTAFVRFGNPCFETITMGER